MISTDFYGKNFSARKLISFFPYTQSEGDGDISRNSISKIPNDSRKFCLRKPCFDIDAH